MTTKCIDEKPVVVNTTAQETPVFGYHPLPYDEAREAGVPFEVQATGSLEAPSNVVSLDPTAKAKPRSRTTEKKPKKPTAIGELVLGTSGDIKPLRINALIVLESSPAWQGVCGFDDMLKRCTFTKRPPLPFYAGGTGEWSPSLLDDEDYARIGSWFAACDSPIYFQVGCKEVRSSVQEFCRRHTYNEAKDRILATTWDGVERLPMMLFTYLSADPGDQSTQEGIDQAYYVSEVGKRWMIGAVARLFKPGCQMRTAVIFEGNQDLGKTKFGQIMAGRYHSSSLPTDLESVAAMRHLRDKWMVELGEMRMFSRASAEATKDFISREVDNYDDKYKHDNNDNPRRCVFYGTTNKSHYLKDETGNTRFWPVRCGDDLNLELLRIDRDQLFAEAYSRFLAGEPWWFTNDDKRLKAVAAVAQGKRMIVDSWEDTVSTWLTEERRSFVTIPEVAKGCLGAMNDLDITNPVSTRVSLILETLGWKFGVWRRTDQEKNIKGESPQRRCYRGPVAL